MNASNGTANMKQLENEYETVTKLDMQAIVRVQVQVLLPLKILVPLLTTSTPLRDSYAKQQPPAV